ncbi:conserved hypothetical protein [Mycoplasma leachii PG50]|uniref:DUF2326 domain-containing protein n=1 Tax=Mycoplasma leachii (strain DSM 21131 / NCTC 10133 / N29 / PG50) TaxID=880447 RepID=E4PSN2_MYCLG|nr:DUF2326 domain-containing protein [Mycoplasma leachii]ADR23918.1 conserved hypothetical protein [Mycoplasma leachii PG50]CBV67501.1 Putative uncharacterized protein [Mycoplasma leachii 99/014/6]
MFIKQLKISTPTKLIRELNFTKGVNLIVDNTPLKDDKTTGNNVGKTTILKLINYCLGGKAEQIYKDQENRKKVDTLVQNFLIDNKILITLTLTNDFKSNEKDIVIERNFLKKSEAILKFNNTQISEFELKNKLFWLFFQRECYYNLSFLQLISRNMRYKEESINNTLNTIKLANKTVNESLNLFLFGFDLKGFDKKESLLKSLSDLKRSESKLLNTQTIKNIKDTINVLDNHISELKTRKKLLGVDENFEKKLDEFNQIKFKINQLSSKISNLELRQNLILESKKELENQKFNVNLDELKEIYQEQKRFNDNMQIEFEQLLNFHNSMTDEKIKFITQQLPSLHEQIIREKEKLNKLLKKEEDLSIIVHKQESFKTIESIVNTISKESELKGRKEQQLEQVLEIENKLNQVRQKVEEFEKTFYSDEIKNQIDSQIKQFNDIFYKVTSNFYNDGFVLEFDKKKDKKQNIDFYEFQMNQTSNSSGKKQGEIVCFDISYIIYADQKNIKCPRFLLTDKKELMHNNQLLKLPDLVNKNNIQLIVPILKDKIPQKILDSANIIIELSENDKLFRIENN